MADNVAVTPGLGATIATDDIGGVQYQIVKLTQGVLDSQTLVSVSNGLPVAGAQQGSPVYVSPGLKTTETFTRAAISFAASGDNIVVAASVGNTCRVYGLLFTVTTPVAVKIGEGGPTYYSGAMQFGVGGGVFLAPQGEPYFVVGATNRSFLINLSAVVQTSGIIWYTLVP